MLLTEHIIEKTPTPTKRTRLNDGNCLYLIINPNGSKWWRFDYKFDGKRKTLSMGFYPGTDLSTARENRDKAIKLLANGINPSDQKKAAKISERAASKTQSKERFLIDNEGALTFNLGRRSVVLTQAETMDLCAFLETRKKGDPIARVGSNAEVGAQDQTQASPPSQDTQPLLQSQDKTSKHGLTYVHTRTKLLRVEVRKKRMFLKI
jgi:hypothetical protein